MEVSACVVISTVLRSSRRGMEYTRTCVRKPGMYSGICGSNRYTKLIIELPPMMVDNANLTLQPDCLPGQSELVDFRQTFIETMPPAEYTESRN